MGNMNDKGGFVYKSNRLVNSIVTTPTSTFVLSCPDTEGTGFRVGWGRVPRDELFGRNSLGRDFKPTFHIGFIGCLQDEKSHISIFFKNPLSTQMRLAFCRKPREKNRYRNSVSVGPSDDPP